MLLQGKSLIDQVFFNMVQNQMLSIVVLTEGRSDKWEGWLKVMRLSVECIVLAKVMEQQNKQFNLTCMLH